ncbi:hypothetical protein BUALT_Bualt07G0063300 [Buddleja alternifolia]|uniref:Uncharacterized protein n=1 Tax=Buddleja alternifolia TaxID=168488 RepID=A0AAV6X9W2_9LAMI|nr:hypothetical protein BUALT_Bualt07G0063300 [Buddleja alternifolia]
MPRSDHRKAQMLHGDHRKALYPRPDREANLSKPLGFPGLCERTKLIMSSRGFKLVVSCLFLLYSFGHGYEQGWSDAHATFYGGGDASGTMGMYLYLYIYIYTYICHSSQFQIPMIIDIN